jgi:glycerate kinase
MVYKNIVIPDSFKGTLSSLEVCEVMKQSILTHFPDCDAHAIPIADGGEGTVDCFLYVLPGAKKVKLTASGPFGSPVSCYYARYQNTAMCDIDNPMYGKRGSAYVFAPQKGAYTF